jgi:hypothetical protein
MPQAVVSFPQTLFASSTGVFSAGGPYTLTVAVPACFFQVDLFHGGGAPDSLGAINAGPGGVAGYAWSSPNKVCETTPPGETVPTPGGSTTPVNTVTTETTTTTTTTTTPTTTTTTPTTTTGGTAPTTQEVAGESTGGNNDVLGTVAAAAHLPFTGVSLLLVTVAGILLALLGFALRGIARRGNAR